jgi:hypothetical protein
MSLTRLLGFLLGCIYDHSGSKITLSAGSTSFDDIFLSKAIEIMGCLAFLLTQTRLTAHMDNTPRLCAIPIWNWLLSSMKAILAYAILILGEVAMRVGTLRLIVRQRVAVLLEIVPPVWGADKLPSRTLGLCNQAKSNPCSTSFSLSPSTSAERLVIRTRNRVGSLGKGSSTTAVDNSESSSEAKFNGSEQLRAKLSLQILVNRGIQEFN